MLAWEAHTYSGPGFLSTGSVVVLDPPGVALSGQITAPNGSGSFGTSPHVADFDGDGNPDLVTGAPKSYGPGGESAAGHVRILYGPAFTAHQPRRRHEPQPPRRGGVEHRPLVEEAQADQALQRRDVPDEVRLPVEEDRHTASNALTATTE